MTNSPNMTIVRMEKDKNYTCVSNAIIFDKSLSLTAKMLMLQMCAVNAEKWNVNDEGLSSLLGKGIKAVKRALNELVQHGYLFKYQVKDEQTKQFSHNQYNFYESPMLNPHFGKSAQSEPDFFAPAPSGRKPSDGQANQLTTEPSNKKELNTDMSQSVAGEKTDGFSENSELFSATENFLKEMTGYQYLAENEFKQFVTGAVRYIHDILETANPNEVISKLKEICSAENSLIPFMMKLQKYCEEALKKLKYPHARDSYLRKVISGFLLRYTPNSDKQALKQNIPAEKAQKTPLPFGEMLLKMGHPHVNENNYQYSPFDTFEHFIEYYGENCYDWNKHECCIPNSFTESQPTMFQALRFLFSSCLAETENTDFREFSEECITYLTEAVCTGKRSHTKHTSEWNLLKNINYLNLGIYGNEVSLYTFMRGFYQHFREKLEEYSVKSNYKGYVTSMLVSYLNGEYLAQARVKSTEFDIFEDTD